MCVGGEQHHVVLLGIFVVYSTYVRIFPVHGFHGFHVCSLYTRCIFQRDSLNIPIMFPGCPNHTVCHFPVFPRISPVFIPVPWSSFAVSHPLFDNCVLQAALWRFKAAFGGFLEVFGVFWRLKRVCRTTFTLSDYATPWSAINFAAMHRSSTVVINNIMSARSDASDAYTPRHSYARTATRLVSWGWVRGIVGWCTCGAFQAQHKRPHSG
jgi:hypothetical protein